MEKEHVHGVFESIAEGYDAANDRISLGMHRMWKRCLEDVAVAACAGREPGIVLDVCCGTGDITEQIARAHPELLVVGLDFSDGMLDVAAGRVGGLENVLLVEGNAMDLPFDDATFDAAVVSFGLRNTPDYEQVLRQMARVTRRGGTIACLDASVPDSGFVRPFYRLYYKHIMTLLGGGVRHHGEYEWLYESTQGFLSKIELAALFGRVGLDQVAARPFMCGAAALHTGVVGEAAHVAADAACAAGGRDGQAAQETGACGAHADDRVVCAEGSDGRSVVSFAVGDEL